MSYFDIYTSDPQVSDSHSDDDIDLEISEMNIMNTKQYEIRKAYEKIEILKDYLIDLVKSPSNQEIYYKYKGRIPIEEDILKASEIIRNSLPSYLSDVSMDPIKNMIMNCIHDFSIVAYNNYLSSLTCLFDCISVYKDNINGFYYLNDVSSNNQAINHLVTYICYFSTEHFDDVESFKCCSFYVCKYIRELRLKCKLLEALGFEKVNKYESSDSYKYMYIKLLTTRNKFHLYRRKDPKYFNIYNKYNDLFTSGSELELIDMDDFDGDLNDIGYIRARYIYTNLIISAKKIIQNKETVHDEEFCNKLNKQKEKNNEQLNKYKNLSNKDLLTSLSKDIKKGVIQRLKTKNNNFNDIHCKINLSKSFDCSPTYILHYNDSAPIESEQFFITPFNENSHINDSVLSTTLDNSEIDSPSNNTIENENPNNISQEEVSESVDNEMNDDSVNNSVCNNDNDSTIYDTNRVQVSSPISSNTSLSNKKHKQNGKSSKSNKKHKQNGKTSLSNKKHTRSSKNSNKE